MTSNEKPDADDFRKHLIALQQRMLGAKRIWPHFLFHFTDIQNVISILKNDEILSREEIEKRKKGFVDGANADIINRTDDIWKQYVRFYFRPRTPTLYNNEGIRPKTRIRRAHCPTPVYLLFDSESLLCRFDSKFSDGNLAASRVNVYSLATKFSELPFDKIYHDTYVTSDERDTIIHHRHAEVIIPNRIGLTDLRRIWCRSEAERDTLKALLPIKLWQKWQNKIVASKDHQLFNKLWIYVERVNLTKTKIAFHFNKPRQPEDTGPFEFKLEILEVASNQIYSWSDPQLMLQDHLTFDLSNLASPENYIVTLYLDEYLVYKNSFLESEIDLPF